jgi:hypothetical protein
MGIFKSTGEILNEPWEDFQIAEPTAIRKVAHGWKHDRPMTIDDVVIWEQLYYQGGNVGIYISWAPHAEFYMIVYNLFIDCPEGIQTFYGKMAHVEVAKKAVELGISLPINQAYTGNEDISHISES